MINWLTANTRFLNKVVAVCLVCSMFYVNSLYAKDNPFDAWQTPQYILKAFNEIALKNEYTTTNKRVLKWQKPIHYQFHYTAIQPNSMVEELFHTHFKHLSSITNHSINHSVNNKANLHIYLTNDKNYANVIKQKSGSRVKNLERESNCMGSFKTNQHSEIISGTVILPLDYVYSRGLLIACVVEETTQVMGLPNDAPWVNPSIANDDSKIELLTGLDYILLKLLYSKELKAGMSPNQSTSVLQNTIRQLINHGDVKNAAQLVNQQGLFPLIN